MHWKFCVLELFHLSSVSQPLQVWSRDGSFPRSRERIGPYSVRNEMSLTQNRQLHICKNIQSGGFCWAPERRRLYFPHLISAIFEIFVLHDLNSTELPSLNEPPPEASDRAADLGAVKKELFRVEGRRECGVLCPSEREDVWKHPGLFPQPNQACELGERLLLWDTKKEQLVTVVWLQRSCTQVGGKLKGRRPSLQHWWLIRTVISCSKHKGLLIPFEQTLVVLPTVRECVYVILLKTMFRWMNGFSTCCPACPSSISLTKNAIAVFIPGPPVNSRVV